jgi:copper(I)-binding protein
MRLALTLACVIASAVGAAPEARDAWIALGPPGDTPRAGYLELRNPDAAPIVLSAVRSPAFAKVELHRSERVGDEVRMRAVPRLEVAAGGGVVLAPGGLHLMLFGARSALNAGQRIALTLEFADGTTLTVEAEVRDPRDAPAHAHHGAH